MSYPTSVTAVPTAASPTTSSPTTTSSSSSNVPTSTTPGMTGTAPIATSRTTTVPTTITSTNPYGSRTIVTTAIYTTTPVIVPTPSPVNNSSNTGAIVGGVVGGIALLGLLGLLFFWLRRRRRRNKSDGNFDPDRIVSHPEVDLGEEIVATPFNPNAGKYSGSQLQAAGTGAAGVGAGAAVTGAATRPPTSGPSSSQQRPVTDASPSEDSFQGFVRPGPGEYPEGRQNMYTTQQAASATPRPLTLPVPGGGASSGRMTKGQEAAAGGRQGSGLSMQQEVDGEASGDVRHQDVRREPGMEGGEPRDVPPAYESIT